MKMVRQTRNANTGAATGAHGLHLPATFRGTLPCAYCEGIRHHLDLWPEQHYHMRREWLGGADGALRREEVGRRYADPERGAIVRHGASEMPLFWEVKGPDRLERVFLLGMMTYLADAALFEECHSGVRYPIAQEGDYLALERAYVDARSEPGAPLKVHVEGGLAIRPAMEGPDRMSLVVERFINVLPDEV